MKIKVNKNSIIFSIMLIVLCEPVLLAKTSIDIVFKVLKVITYCYVICDMIISQITKKQKSKTFLFLLLYEAFLVVSTAINGLSIYYAIYYGITFISVFYLVEKNIKRDEEKTLRSILNISLFFLICNIISYLSNINVSGGQTTYYFLGLRTRVTDTIYVYICALIMYLNKEESKKYIIIGIIITIMSLICFNVTTMYIGIAIILLFLLFRKFKIVNKMISSKHFITVIIILIVGIVVFRIQQYFSFIFHFFGKDVDLNYRTFIWDNAFEKIKETTLNLWLGHGITELGEWVIFEGRRWQAHNQYIQIILDSGIIGICIFMNFLKSSLTNLRKATKNIKTYLCFALFISLIIIMITEIYSYYPQMYIVIALLANYKNKEKVEEGSKQI